MNVEVALEHRQLGKVLPLWVPSVSLESPLPPVVEEIRQLCLDYPKRIVESQLREKHGRSETAKFPKQGPAKFGTGIRQIKAEDQV